MSPSIENTRIRVSDATLPHSYRMPSGHYSPVPLVYVRIFPGHPLYPEGSELPQWLDVGPTTGGVRLTEIEEKSEPKTKLNLVFRSLSLGDTDFLILGGTHCLRIVYPPYSDGNYLTKMTDSAVLCRRIRTDDYYQVSTVEYQFEFLKDDVRELVIGAPLPPKGICPCDPEHSEGTCDELCCPGGRYERGNKQCKNSPRGK